jgi:chemotaxis protein MotB
MATMAKRRHAEGEGGGGHETAGMMRWLITYADMITLLLALFIMLYAISNLDIQRFKALMEEFQALFGSGEALMQGGRGMLKFGAPESRRPLVVPLLPGKKPEMHDEEEAMERYIEQRHLEGKVLLHREERGLVISLLTDGIFFAKGSAALSPEAQRVLRDIAPLIIRSGRFVRVEGHTCDLPIHTPRYPSNWELSVARAVAVVRYLIACGVPPRRLSAVGYGEFCPLVPNTSEENRRLNRRVDLVLLSESGQRAEPTYRPEPNSPQRQGGSDGR